MAAGVATLVISIDTYQSLAQTREVYYQSHHFAALFSQSAAHRARCRDRSPRFTACWRSKPA
jgi:hypothetical protein